MVILNFNAFDKAKIFYELHKDSLDNAIKNTLSLQTVIKVGDEYNVSTVHLSDNIKGLKFKVSSYNAENVSLELIDIN